MTKTWTLLLGDAGALSVHDGYGQSDPEVAENDIYVPAPRECEVWVTYAVADTTTLANDSSEFYTWLSVGDAYETGWHGVESIIAPGETPPGFFSFQRDVGGAVYVDDTEAYVWGTKTRLHVLFDDGARVRANRWPDGETEPAGWMIDEGDTTDYRAFDALFFGIYGGQSVNVYEVIMCPAGITDSFSRTLPEYARNYYGMTSDVPSWGTTTGNTVQAWHGDSVLSGVTFYGVPPVFIGRDVTASVDGTQGVLYAAPFDFTYGWETWLHRQWLGWTPTYGTAGDPGDPEPPLDATWDFHLASALVAWTYPDGGYLTFTFGTFDQVTWPDPGGRFAVILAADGIRNSEDASLVSLPCDLTAPTRLRVTCDGPGEPVKVYLWAASGTQPGSPTMTIAALAAYSNHGVMLEVVSPTPVNSMPIDPDDGQTVYVDWLNVIGSADWT